MKLLYISSYHCGLEHDELKLFHEMGIEVLSTGKYLDPRNPRFESLRPPLDIDTDPALREHFSRLNRSQIKWANPVLTVEFVNNFDAVYISHVGPNKVYLYKAWNAIKHMPVIYRTYGLQSEEQEERLGICKREGKILAVRFSEKESAIKQYAGTDFVILPYVDEDYFKNWNGNAQQVWTQQNWYASRRSFEPYHTYENIVKPFNPRLHGIATPSGEISQEAVLAGMQNSRVYFALGTKPSPITINAFEALMVGAPVVAWGPQLGNGVPPMYQMHEIIKNYESGLCSDNPQEITEFIQKCFDDYEYAKLIGRNARLLALNTFSKAVARTKWEQVFKTL